MTSAELLRWARGEAMSWFDKRHDPKREGLEEVIARAYLMGQIDALKEETERLIRERSRLRQ